MDKIPLISVVLPVYNCDRYIQQSIDSILLQTFNNFELIIIDDGSTDNTKNIIKSFNDPRIKIVSKSNSGLVDSLNIGIKLAKGAYIARQDADDISFPERLFLQFQMLNNNPQLAMVGSCGFLIDASDLILKKIRLPLSYQHIKYTMLYYNPFIHSSIMVRRDILNIVGHYNKPKLSTKENFPEDYELWTRIAISYQVQNISVPLVGYRINTAGISQNRPYDFYSNLRATFDAYRKLLLPKTIHNTGNHIAFDAINNILAKRRLISDIPSIVFAYYESAKCFNKSNVVDNYFYVRLFIRIILKYFQCYCLRNR